MNPSFFFEGDRMRLRKLIKDQYFWYTTIAAIISCIFAYAPQITAGFPAPLHTDPMTAYYMAGYRLFLPLAVIFASWRWGSRVGWYLCLVVGGAIIISVFINSKFPNIIIDFLDITLAVVLGWMVGRQSEFKKRLEATTAELKSNSQKLTQEISDRKRVEQQYQLIADHTADIIYKLFIKDGKFNYISPSTERILGYTQSEGLAMKLTDLLTPESFQKQNAELMAAMQQGITSATLQLELKHKDRRIIPFEVHASLVFDDKGQPAEIVGVARDITERRKMEEQLTMQDRLASIGQLTSGMAHELNNPLTSIINFSSLLLKKETDEETRLDITTIHHEAQRIAGIVKNLLAFSRKQPQQKQPTDINECIRKVLEMRAYEQQVNNIKVQVSYDRQLPFITANSAQLEQVFFNIVINAEYFMIEAHKEGKLDIITQRDGDIVRILFTDNGPGISEENIKSVFSPFFTTKEAGRGTGLSLSICQGIVNEHGGKIYVKNDESGGATFVIELPVNGK
jgi:PAS domain S-box-containing protein